MIGLSFEKLIVIAVITAVLIGPERLPAAASALARLVKTLRSLANDARDRVRDEMGDDFESVDWKKLDPRQYDPRRIIRDALAEDSVHPTRRDTATEHSGDAGDRSTKLK